jgi:hypothetical protein
VLATLIANGGSLWSTAFRSQQQPSVLRDGSQTKAKAASSHRTPQAESQSGVEPQAGWSHAQAIRYKPHENDEDRGECMPGGQKLSIAIPAI